MMRGFLLMTLRKLVFIYKLLLSIYNQSQLLIIFTDDFYFSLTISTFHD